MTCMHSESEKTEIQMARLIAPEDIVRGQYLVIMGEIEEIEPFFCTSDLLEKQSLPIRYERMCGYIEPIRVLAVCVPFILIRYVTGQVRSLDCRQTRFARVDAAYGQLVWRAHRTLSKRKKKAKRKLK